jgi:hypothetical protein
MRATVHQTRRLPAAALALLLCTLHPAGATAQGSGASQACQAPTRSGLATCSATAEADERNRVLAVQGALDTGARGLAPGYPDAALATAWLGQRVVPTASGRARYTVVLDVAHDQRTASAASGWAWTWADARITLLDEGGERVASSARVLPDGARSLTLDVYGPAAAGRPVTVQVTLRAGAEVSGAFPPSVGDGSTCVHTTCVPYGLEVAPPAGRASASLRTTVSAVTVTPF